MHDDDDDDDNWDDGDGGYGAGWRSASSSDDGMPLARRDDVWVSESEHEDGEDDASGHVKQGVNFQLVHTVYKWLLYVSSDVGEVCRAGAFII